jgi:succinyl-CoA synthetase beta subunit
MFCLSYFLAILSCCCFFLSPSKVAEIVEKMLGHRLITKQTSKEGIFVKKVMIAESVNIMRETYLCILLDRLASELFNFLTL